MKNVTISLDDDVARWARVWAAEHETSVSRMVGDLVRERMQRDKAYDSSRRRFLRKKPTALKRRGAKYPTRDSIHE